jgi:hypothetical protein
LSFPGCADHAEELDCVLEHFKHLAFHFRGANLINKGEGVLDEDLVQFSVQEYLAQPNVLGDDHEQLRNL